MLESKPFEHSTLYHCLSQESVLKYVMTWIFEADFSRCINMQEIHELLEENSLVIHELLRVLETTVIDGLV